MTSAAGGLSLGSCASTSLSQSGTSSTGAAGTTSAAGAISSGTSASTSLSQSGTSSAGAAGAASRRSSGLVMSSSSGTPCLAARPSSQARAASWSSRFKPAGISPSNAGVTSPGITSAVGGMVSGISISAAASGTSAAATAGNPASISLIQSGNFSSGTAGAISCEGGSSVPSPFSSRSQGKISTAEGPGSEEEGTRPASTSFNQSVMPTGPVARSPVLTVSSHSVTPLS